MFLSSVINMAMHMEGDEKVDWEDLFNQETPEHIRKSITMMENDILGKFRPSLGRDVTMSNYWRLKFILSHSMNERENFTDLVRIIVSTFKEDV